MDTQPQSPIHHQHIQGNQQNISGQVTGPVVGGNVGQIGDIVNNYITQPAQRPPLWIDVPSMPAHFVGRDPIVAELVARLTGGGSVALSAEGKPGVGKTTLAVALAHHRDVLAHFSDGVLWAGLGPQPDLPSRLARWANALGVDVSDRPTVEARAQAVRDAIGHRRLLLVIDDAWQLEAAELLRCGGPHCAHLLTSRDQRLAFAFAGRSERVEELTPADALELLRRLAAKAVAADETQAAGLLAAVGYLPLAVELLGGYLAAGASARFADASRSALADLTDPARRLALATRRLGDGSGQRMSLEEVISLSIDGLAEESPEAVAVLYSLGAFAPKPASFDRAAAQAVAECDTDALALLIERNLLEQDDADESLALHQTIADVARTHTPVEAVTRHCEYYLPLVNANLGQMERVIEHLAQALAVSRKIGDRLTERIHLGNLGQAYFSVKNLENTFHHFWQALVISREIGDRRGEGIYLGKLGLAYLVVADWFLAIDCFEQALVISHEIGDRLGEVIHLGNLGQAHRGCHAWDAAIDYYTRALSILEDI